MRDPLSSVTREETRSIGLALHSGSSRSLDAVMRPKSDFADKEHQDHPLVSVIIPTYNRAWALKTTVASVFAQTYRPLECLVVDDGSTDETQEVVRVLSDECPSEIALRYFKQDNGGANSARNRGLAECTGDFICYLDSDDLLTPDSIGERAQVLIKDADLDFCYGLTSIRNKNGDETGRMNTRWPGPDEPRIAPYLFNTISPLMRRSACVRTGLWREDDTHGQESEYFARLKYFSNKAAFIDKTLSIYIRHGKGSLFDPTSLPWFLATFRALLAIKALIVYGRHDNQAERRHLAIAFRVLGKQLLRLRDYPHARAALEESLILKWTPKALAGWLIATPLAIPASCRKRAKSGSTGAAQRCR